MRLAEQNAEFIFFVEKKEKIRKEENVKGAEKQTYRL